MKQPVSPSDLRRVSELLCELDVLARNFQIYGMAHPRTQEAKDLYLERATDVQALAIVQRGQVVIARRGDRFYLENLPLLDSAQRSRFLSQRLDAGRYGGFLLELRCRDDELWELVDYLGGRSRPGAAEPVVPSGFSWLSHEELARIEARRAGPQRDADELDGKRNVIFSIPELRIEEEFYDLSVSELQSFMRQCAACDRGDYDPLLSVTQSLVDQLLQRAESVMPLTTLPYHDNFPYYHSVNVCLLTLRAAQLVVPDRGELSRIGQAALLHDLGKARTPEEILYKAGTLSTREREVMMEHPVTGARMLLEFPFVDPLMVNAAFGHHIRDGGAGYPAVSNNFKVGAVTMMVEVADIFEALTANRPYKKAMTSVQAFEILYGMADLESRRPYIDLLFNAIGMQPLGSRVKTGDGEYGVVCGHRDGDPVRPLVQIVGAENGRIRLSRRIEGVSDGSADDAVAIPVKSLDPQEEFSPSASW